MERVSAMLDYLKDEMGEGLEKFKQEMLVFDGTQERDAIEILKSEIESEEICVVITYLRSSYITGSHQFKISLYENDPFMSDATMCRFIDLAPLYKRVPEFIDDLTRKIKSQFIRVMPFEIEEIRRSYMDYLYKNSSFFFERIVNEMRNDEGGKIKNIVYFGEEMGETEEIG